jgi:hypothetical protein
MKEMPIDGMQVIEERDSYPTLPFGFCFAVREPLRGTGRARGQRFTHLIEPETLRNDDFDAFFERRTGALLAMIGKAMGKSSTVEASEGLAHGKAQRNGLSFPWRMGKLSQIPSGLTTLAIPDSAQ